MQATDDSHCDNVASKIECGKGPESGGIPQRRKVRALEDDQVNVATIGGV